MLGAVLLLVSLILIGSGMQGYYKRKRPILSSLFLASALVPYILLWTKVRINHYIGLFTVGYVALDILYASSMIMGILWLLEANDPPSDEWEWFDQLRAKWEKSLSKRRPDDPQK